MANIPLQSITFPELADKYTTPTVDATLTQTGAAADAKKTGDEIAELKNDLNQISDYVDTINLVDPNMITSGFVSPYSGNLSASSDYYTTDFIPVTGGKYAVYSNMENTYISARFMAVYDSDKHVISPTGEQGGDGTQTNSKYFLLGASAAYIRVSFATNIPAVTVMVSLNDDYSIPPFVKYSTPHYEASSSFVSGLIPLKMTITADEGIDAFCTKMLNAFTYGNYDVYIGKGNYIYTNEFIDALRADGKRGVPIGGGCRYFFETGSKILCEYTGSNASDVVDLFSPLDSQSIATSYEIYNLTLVAKNVCYGLHDEAGGKTNFCKHVYKDCYIELDNTALGDDGNAISKAIGGGLGAYEEVIIEGCVFKSVNPKQAEAADVTYHGASGQTFTDAKMIVSGNYFEQSFRVGVSGQTGTQPRIICNNNSCGSGQPIFGSVDAKAWNNVVRS